MLLKEVVPLSVGFKLFQDVIAIPTPLSFSTWMILREKVVTFENIFWYLVAPRDYIILKVRILRFE